MGHGYANCAITEGLTSCQLGISIVALIASQLMVFVSNFLNKNICKFSLVFLRSKFFHCLQLSCDLSFAKLLIS